MGWGLAPWQGSRERRPAGRPTPSRHPGVPASNSTPLPGDHPVGGLKVVESRPGPPVCTSKKAGPECGRGLAGQPVMAAHR